MLIFITAHIPLILYFLHKHVPPYVGLCHETLKPIAELKERIHLERVEGIKEEKQDNNCEVTPTNVSFSSLTYPVKHIPLPAYPDEAVESVKGRESKIDGEEVKGDDADQINLQKRRKQEILLCFTTVFFNSVI